MQILRASAGSGKTYALAYEYIKNVIKAPEKYGVILAVTFTNKATDEMKRRILKELDLLRTPTTPSRHSYLDRLISELSISEETVSKNATLALSYILHDYSRFSVLTIDRFFQKILRAFVKELGVESDYAVDFNIDYIIDLAIDKVVDNSKENEEIEKNLKNFTDELIADSKSYNIKAALAQYAKNIFSEEFGEVKRDVLVAFYSVAKEKRSLFIDEMVRLAKNALKIIEENNLTADDFPYKNKGLYGYLKNVANKEIKDHNSYVATALTGNWGKGKSLAKIECVKDEIIQNLSQVCDLWSENKKYINSVDVFAKNFRKFMLLGDISNEVDNVCQTSNIMLLSTTMKLMTSLTSENDAPFIYEKCGNSYEVFMIDEFQDTSVRQWGNFVPLINNALAQCDEMTKCVTIVGDVKQSIYRWRGGDWKLLQGGLKDDILFQDVIDEITLDTNWRSSRIVVAFNNALIGKVASSLNSSLNEELKAAENNINETQDILIDTLKNAYLNAEQKFVSKNSNKEGYVSVSECDFSVEENLKRMITAIKDIQDRGCLARDIAIITRTNKEAKCIVESLLEQKDIVGNEKYCFDAISNQALYLTNSKAVKLVIVIFKLGLLNHVENTILVAEYNKYLGRDLNCEVPDYERDVIAQIRELSVIEAFEKIVDCYNPAKTKNDVAYVQALYEQIISFSVQNVTDVATFLDWWDKEKGKLSITLPDGQNAINVITIHAVKGLEYEAVLIPYFNWKLEPMTNEQIWVEQAGDDFEIANNTLVPYVNLLADSYFANTYFKEKVMSYVDNVNVLYVAVTRAAKELYIMLPTKASKNTVAESLNNALTCSEGSDLVSIGDGVGAGEELDTSISGKLSSWLNCDGETRVEYVFGKKVDYTNYDKPEKKTESIIIDELKSLDYHKNDRIQLRYSTERYYEDQKTGEKHLTPRSYGILMHKLFERIDSYKDVVSELEAMRVDGILTSSECNEIAVLVNKAFENSDILQFFDTDWTVKNEQNILVPTYGEKVVSLRPDRVVVSGNKAKVLDYKFGGVKNDKNLAQMRNYVQLLMEMGYEDVQGYIWYVQLGEVDNVNVLNDK
ncbi:MAG: UvrD-helicase domain-containing protein [Rikenellaceae bacterium]